ncbi:MAG: hypothetical protein ABL872_10905 [Lacibacter sp.]
MKQVLAILFLAAVSCNNAPEKEALAMSGAYSMLSQSIKGEKIDTSYSNLKQLKIFTGDQMMYANVNPADSVSSFGIGTYSSSMDTITETVLYNASDSSASDSAQSFHLTIEKTAKGYKQIIPEIGTGEQKIKLTEEYETVGTKTTSTLDGLWKMTKSYSVKGTDTSKGDGIQYKMYNAGHFMFGNTWTDSTKKLHTGIGFGTFIMEGTTKVKESVTASTYYEIRGQSFDIEIEMTGTDEFKQILTNKDGTKNVEFYQRVKK